MNFFTQNPNIICKPNVHYLLTLVEIMHEKIASSAIGSTCEKNVTQNLNIISKPNAHLQSSDHDQIKCEDSKALCHKLQLSSTSETKTGILYMF